MGLYEKYLTTKNRLVCVLYFAYIYDLVRAGFLESRHKHRCQLIQHDSISSYIKDQCASPPLRSARAAAVYFKELPVEVGRKRRLSRLLETIHRSVRESVHKLSLLAPFGGRALVRASGLEARYYEGLDKISPPTAKTATLAEDSARGSAVFDHDEVDECPLEAKPLLIRIYELISHLLVGFSFIKYLVLNLLHEELFGLQKIFSCYIPGRTAVLPFFSPSFPLIVLFYHVIYRIYLRLVRKSFHIDCFLFVLYDRHRVESIEERYNETLLRLRRLQEATKLPSVRKSSEETLVSKDLYKLYANNRMFFTCCRQMDGRFTYRLRSNRTLKHWLKLRKFYHNYTLACAINFGIWAVPLAILILTTVLSETNINILYGHCNGLSDNLNPNKWAWTDWRRLIWFSFDIIDNAWLLFDTANALVWPFSSMVLCAQDMTYSVDHLLEAAASITKRLEDWLSRGKRRHHDQNQLSNSQAATGADEQRATRALVGGRQIYWLTSNNSREQQFSSIEEGILMLQNEINDTLQQMSLIDEYVSRQSIFCIFCFIVTNMYYQIMSLREKRILVPSAVIQFMQVTAFTAISLSFGYMSRTHAKAIRLHNQICYIVALDPNHKMKLSWLWVLEYFQQDQSRYSFHLGPFAELSLSNYLKSISWLITGALVTISLFKHRFELSEAGLL